MFCPQCGQERHSEVTNYCSKCGFLLTGTAEMLVTGGIALKTTDDAAGLISPRKRGLKQGLFIFLLTFLVVPIISIVTVALQAQPFGVAIAAIIFFMGGLLRMAYAMMFESAGPINTFSADIPSLKDQIPFLRKPAPSLQSGVEDYVSPATGNWRDTNDLEPRSVTENTTKLLEKDQ